MLTSPVPPLFAAFSSISEGGGCAATVVARENPIFFLLSPSIFFFDRRVIVPGKPVFFTGIANSSADVCKIVRKKTLEKRIALPP